MALLIAFVRAPLRRWLRAVWACAFILLLACKAAGPESVRIDREAPTILETTPAHGDVNAARRDPIGIRFSEPILQGSFMEAVQLEVNGAPSEWSAEFSDDDAAVLLHLEHELEMDSVMRLRMGTTLLDRAHNSLEENFDTTWKFPAWRDIGTPRTDRSETPLVAVGEGGTISLALSMTSGGDDETIRRVLVYTRAGNEWVELAEPLNRVPLNQSVAGALSTDGELPVVAWSEFADNGRYLPERSDAFVSRWDGHTWVPLGSAVNGAQGVGHIATPVALQRDVNGAFWVLLRETELADDGVVISSNHYVLYHWRGAWQQVGQPLPVTATCVSYSCASLALDQQGFPVVAIGASVLAGEEFGIAVLRLSSLDDGDPAQTAWTLRASLGSGGASWTRGVRLHVLPETGEFLLLANTYGDGLAVFISTPKLTAWHELGTNSLRGRTAYVFGEGAIGSLDGRTPIVFWPEGNIYDRTTLWSATWSDGTWRVAEFGQVLGSASYQDSVNCAANSRNFAVTFTSFAEQRAFERAHTLAWNAK